VSFDSFLRPDPAPPPFGGADLSNCEREPIHLAGSIQPHGALLVVREPSLEIVQASANARSFLGLAQKLQGRTLDSLPGDLAAAVRSRLDTLSPELPVAVPCRLGDAPRAYDGLLHRPPGGGLVVELEPAGPAFDHRGHAQSGLEAILTASSLPALVDATAGIFKELTGYDRVMVYRFDAEGHGEILAERKEAALESFLGNRYPSSDIPEIARRLYLQNRVRVLGDVAYTPTPLEPRLSPITGEELDMSFCLLRSMSPIHIQYLKNMGVGATLVVSLVVGGRLWGLIACHHYEPRFVHYELRTVCDLLAENVATRIAALESFAQAQAEVAVRRLEQRMVRAVSRDGDWQSALFDNPQFLLQPLEASGAALLFEGEVLTAGDVPGTQELRDIAAWLDRQPRAPVISTASLGLDERLFAPLIPVASGLAAVPLSNAPGEYLMWFRPERVRTVTWGGNPFKPFLVGDDPSQLSPRRSFAKWHQLVEGTSDPWTPADLSAARMIGESVADVALQFRSVRMLIAQDQLERVRRQVRQSDPPVVIVDAEGRLLLTNDAFERLLPEGQPPLARLEELSELFLEPAEVREILEDLLRLRRRTWHGEVRLADREGDARPLLVQADPVLAPSERLLGFVLLFTDLSERRVAEAARLRFQEGVAEQRSLGQSRLGRDPRYRDLHVSIVGNAELAALEVTEGVNTAEMADLLDGVRTSILRMETLLDHLAHHRHF